jgi:hypothetical protein
MASASGRLLLQVRIFMRDQSGGRQAAHGRATPAGEKRADCNKAVLKAQSPGARPKAAALARRIAAPGRSRGVAGSFRKRIDDSAEDVFHQCHAQQFFRATQEPCATLPC